MFGDIRVELHDDVGSNLSSIALLSEMLQGDARLGGLERRQLQRILLDKFIQNLAGANSIFYGPKLLTTPNPAADRDRQLMDRLGLRALRLDRLRGRRPPSHHHPKGRRNLSTGRRRGSARRGEAQEASSEHPPQEGRRRGRGGRRARRETAPTGRRNPAVRPGRRSPGPGSCARKPGSGRLRGFGQRWMLAR